MVYNFVRVHRTHDASNAAGDEVALEIGDVIDLAVVWEQTPGKSEPRSEEREQSKADHPHRRPAREEHQEELVQVTKLESRGVLRSSGLS